MKKRVGWFLGVLLALNLVSAAGDFLTGFMETANFLFGGSNDAITIVKLIFWIILFLTINEVASRIFTENKGSAVIVSLLLAWVSVRFFPDELIEEYGVAYLSVWVLLLGAALVVWLFLRLRHFLGFKDPYGNWKKGVLFVSALILFFLAYLLYRFKDVEVYFPDFSFNFPGEGLYLWGVGAINTLWDLVSAVIHYLLWIFVILGIIFLLIAFFALIFGGSKYQAQPSRFLEEIAKVKAQQFGSKPTASGNTQNFFINSRNQALILQRKEQQKAIEQGQKQSLLEQKQNALMIAEKSETAIRGSMQRLRDTSLRLQKNNPGDPRIEQVNNKIKDLRRQLR